MLVRQQPEALRRAVEWKNLRNSMLTYKSTCQQSWQLSLKTMFCFGLFLKKEEHGAKKREKTLHPTLSGKQIQHVFQVQLFTALGLKRYLALATSVDFQGVRIKDTVLSGKTVSIYKY